MKKIVLLSFLLCIGYSSNAQLKLGLSTGYAFLDDSFNSAPQFGLDDPVGRFGVGADIIYTFNDDYYEVAVDGFYYPVKDNNWYAFDLNGHYFLTDMLYSIVGAHYRYFENPTNVDIYDGDLNAKEKFGLNLGGGIRIGKYERIMFLGELKYVSLRTGYWNFRVGVLLKI